MYEEITLQDLDRDKVNVMRRSISSWKGQATPSEIFSGGRMRTARMGESRSRRRLRSPTSAPLWRYGEKNPRYSRRNRKSLKRRHET